MNAAGDDKARAEHQPRGRPPDPAGGLAGPPALVLHLVGLLPLPEAEPVHVALDAGAVEVLGAVAGAALQLGGGPLTAEDADAVQAAGGAATAPEKKKGGGGGGEGCGKSG